MHHNDWSKYDTYSIASTDINSLSYNELWRVVRTDLRGCNSADAQTITTFINDLPPDQSFAVLQGLAYNYKQASMVRDEVAMARFGGDSNYAWLSYPLLTWSSTPGQNSWSAITFPNSYVTTMPGTMDNDIAMTNDFSRPMRMVMSRGKDRDINYDRAVRILSSGLTDLEAGNIHVLFHPAAFDPLSYTNETELDSITRVIECNASMVDHLNRYAWYNHMNKTSGGQMSMSN
jgi:hypothetical protein